MQGTLRKQRHGCQWMRVGSAEPKFSRVFVLASLFVVICLAFRTYTQLPATGLRPVYFIAIYLIAAVLYLNLGVWIHEQLHCLPFRGTVYEKHLQIFYQRKYLVALHGYYRVTGAIDYQILRRALLGPLGLVTGWLVIGWLGSLILPGWWFPTFGTLAAVSALDMVHDFYWLSRTQQVGEKGKYWDNGHELEVVWRGQQ